MEEPRHRRRCYGTGKYRPLVNFCTRVEKKLYELMDWKVARSKDMAFKQLKPTFAEMRVHNKEFKIMGIIDVIQKDFEGNISIVDYKTSKRYGSWLPDDYYRQLIIYALLYQEETGVRPKFAGIDWLRYDDVYFVAINDGVIEEARELIKGIHDELKRRGTTLSSMKWFRKLFVSGAPFIKSPVHRKVYILRRSSCIMGDPSGTHLEEIYGKRNK